MSEGLCKCGCGKPTSIARRTRSDRGYVKGQPIPYISGHNTCGSDLQKIITFMNKVKLIPSGGRPDCMEWDGTIQEGYGFQHKTFGEYLAHRISYTFCYGPIPKGLEIDHRCTNRSCVNPEHLEAVTPQINSRRCYRTKLTVENVDEIRASSESPRTLARRFGVHRQTIRHIIKGINWKVVNNV
jgi:hypothetical protein